MKEMKRRLDEVKCADRQRDSSDLSALNDRISGNNEGYLKSLIRRIVQPIVEELHTVKGNLACLLEEPDTSTGLHIDGRHGNNLSPTVTTRVQKSFASVASGNLTSNVPRKFPHPPKFRLMQVDLL